MFKEFCIALALEVGFQQMGRMVFARTVADIADEIMVISLLSMPHKGDLN